MKKIILSLLVVFATTAMWADTALFVHQKSGGQVEFACSEKPVVTYSDGYLVVTEQTASLSFPLSDVEKFTFGEVDDQVTRITAPVDMVAQPTFIYTIGGILVRTYQPGDNNTTSASLEGLPAGTYVVKNGKTSYKIAKK